jgi:hypothetical protein
VIATVTSVPPERRSLTGVARNPAQVGSAPWGSTCMQVVAEQALVLASEQFEEAARGDSAALLEYCARKAESCHGSEAETWSFLRIMFHGQPIACAPSPCSSLTRAYRVFTHKHTRECGEGE